MRNRRYLQRNRIARIDGSPFAGLRRLAALTIGPQNSTEVNVSGAAFSCPSPNLTTLVLGGLHIAALPPRAFAGVTSLHVMPLRSMAIARIADFAFEGSDFPGGIGPVSRSHHTATSI